MKQLLLALAFFFTATMAEAQNTFSLNAGYVNKDWATDFDGSTYHENLWGEEGKRLHGFQIGFDYTPHTSIGFGLQTGAYFEGYYSYSPAVRDLYSYDHYEEYSLYVPAHLMWQIPFSRAASLTLFGGGGLNWALFGKFQDDEYYYDYWYDQFTNWGDFAYANEYGRNGWPEHFNIQWEAGATLRIKNLQFKFTYSRGITDHGFYSRNGNYKTLQNKLAFAVGVSI